MTNSMETMFPGFFKPQKDTVQAMWERATFVFDTNVLLNLYRYSDKAREEFLGTLKQIKSEDRIWVPHQAVFEYFENRLAVIKTQAESYDKTIQAMEQLKSTFGSSKQHPFVAQSSLDELNRLFDKIKEELNESKKVHTSRVKADMIQADLANIFDGKIGDPFDEKALSELFIDGEKRYKENIPPGYKDSEKAKDDSLKARKKKFGDLIVWRQTLSMAKETKKDIIFVTDDKKDDWWLNERGETLGPRPELVKEFKDVTACDFLMYRAHTFALEAIEKLGSKITLEIVDEIRQVEADNDLTLALKKYKALYDIVSYLNGLSLSTGDSIPSERKLSKLVEHTRSVVREHLGRLESYGYIRKMHGKSTELIRNLPDLDDFDDDAES